jgi:hypothetical protein
MRGAIYAPTPFAYRVLSGLRHYLGRVRRRCQTRQLVEGRVEGPFFEFEGILAATSRLLNDLVSLHIAFGQEFQNQERCCLSTVHDQRAFPATSM